MTDVPEFARTLTHILELRNEVALELQAAGFADVAQEHSDIFDSEATRSIVDAHVTAEVDRRLAAEDAAARRARVGR